MVEKLVSCCIWHMVCGSPYSSSMCNVGHWNRSSGKERTLRRKCDRMDFPLFCCWVSVNTVRNKWAVCPWNTDREERWGHNFLLRCSKTLVEHNCLITTGDHSQWRGSSQLFIVSDCTETENKSWSDGAEIHDMWSRIINALLCNISGISLTDSVSRYVL